MSIPCFFSYTISVQQMKVPFDLSVFSHEVFEQARAATKFQYEQGKNGYLHYQGIVYFRRKQQTKLSTVVNLIGSLFNVGKSFHTELLTTWDHIINTYNYVGKESTKLDGPWEFGKFPDVLLKKIAGDSKKDTFQTRLSQFREDGRVLPYSELVVKYADIHARYRHYFNLFALKKDKVLSPKVILIQAPSGAGKSRLIETQFPDAIVGKVGQDLRWFDDCVGAEVIVFENFRLANVLPFLDDFLKFIDRYITKLPIKGTFIDRVCHTIVINTNEDVNDYFVYQEGDYSSVRRSEFFRRITRMYRLEGNVMKQFDVQYNRVSTDVDWSQVSLI